MKPREQLKVFAGQSHPDLAKAICTHLGIEPKYSEDQMAIYAPTIKCFHLSNRSKVEQHPPYGTLKAIWIFERSSKRFERTASLEPLPWSILRGIMTAS